MLWDDWNVHYVTFVLCYSALMRWIGDHVGFDSGCPCSTAGVQPYSHLQMTSVSIDFEASQTSHWLANLAIDYFK